MSYFINKGSKIAHIDLGCSGAYLITDEFDRICGKCARRAYKLIESTEMRSPMKRFKSKTIDSLNESELSTLHTLVVGKKEIDQQEVKEMITKMDKDEVDVIDSIMLEIGRYDDDYPFQTLKWDKIDNAPEIKNSKEALTFLRKIVTLDNGNDLAVYNPVGLLAVTNHSKFLKPEDVKGCYVFNWSEIIGNNTIKPFKLTINPGATSLDMNISLTNPMRDVFHNQVATLDTGASLCCFNHPEYKLNDVVYNPSGVGNYEISCLKGQMRLIINNIKPKIIEYYIINDSLIGLDYILRHEVTITHDEVQISDVQEPILYRYRPNNVFLNVR
jgi:hypothetical protein